MKHWLVIVPGAAAVGLLAAACGSSSTSAPSSPAASHAASYPAASSSPAAGAAAGAGAVSLHSVSGVDGQVLVAGNGRALYLFEADKKGTSTCSGACAQAWPPDTVTGAPKAQMGVKQGLLGTVHRADGTTQVTYNGHPLYFFVKDGDAGDAYGQGVKAFGAEWYVLSPSGAKVDEDSSHKSSGGDHGDAS
jgi:predicted lipoprotein with Yx(FWY)xxD motif